jgi:hypothetical protein
MVIQGGAVHIFWTPQTHFLWRLEKPSSYNRLKVSDDFFIITQKIMNTLILVVFVLVWPEQM